MNSVVNEKNSKSKYIEKTRQAIAKAEQFCCSHAFIFIVVGIAFVFHALALDLLGIMLFGLSAAVGFLVFKDCRPSLTVTATAIFIVSTKNSPGYTAGENYYANPEIYIPIIITVCILVVAMAIRCIINRQNYKKARLYIPMAILLVTLTLSGIGQIYYDESFAFGLLMGVSYAGFYLLFVGVINKFDGIMDYISTLLSALCLLIAVQVLYLYVVHIAKGGDFDGYWKGQIILGWGVSNIVGEMMVFFMPFVMYRIEKSKKYYNFYHCVALFAMTMLVLTLNRTGMLFGFPIFAVLWIKAIISIKNKQKIFLTAVIYGSIGLIVLVAASSLTEFSTLFVYFTDMFNTSGGIKLSARDKLWAQAIEFFKKSPIVGAGFAKSFHYPLVPSHATFFQTLYHNFIFQAIASGGIMGILAMLYFGYKAARVFLSKYEGKFHMVCFAILFVCVALFDTVYFITYSVLFFILILVVVEKQSNERVKKNEKS